ncbi:MAG: hypothetical protein JO081_05400 [Alphaproteobacteria bacterium]|nr:hypothetical protein [Alphaproteobacteria bacterium]
MPGSEMPLPWLPALLIAALSAGALLAAAPATANASRRLRLAVIAILGVSALAAEVWQALTVRQEIAHLERNDRAKAQQIAALHQELASFKERMRGRALSAETAAELAAYLQSFGSRTVVVSCIPNDVEAYEYATSIADALRSAKWDARGPETTTIFGIIQAVGINVFNSGAPGSDTTKILTDALAKFGIPYQTRVPPSEALASGTVELFIGAKPGPPAVAVPPTAH